MDGERKPSATDQESTEANRIVVLAPPAVETGSFEGTWDDVLAATSSGESARRQHRGRRRRSRWGSASLGFLMVALPGTIAGVLFSIERYFPSAFNLQGVDGEPPAILEQADDVSGAGRALGTVGEFLTRWPNVLAFPVVAGVLIGLIFGLLRWRLGRSGASESESRQLRLDKDATQALLRQQSDRLQTLDREMELALHQISGLTGELSAQSDHVLERTMEADRYSLDLDTARREAARLSADLDDALAERDQLESQVQVLASTVKDRLAEQQENSDAPARILDLEQNLALSTGELDQARNLIGLQAEKIDQLEVHLDRVRRRAAEMATEVRIVGQLRAAWAKAEDVIVDLRAELEEATASQAGYAPQSAVDIVSGGGRFEELDRLLTGAADQIESLESQLRQTRFQLSDRDAALARTDVREESLRTEVSLLSEEIVQAAYQIALLEDLGSRHHRNEEMIEELRAALEDERARSRDLGRQLSTVTARALRFEERLVAPRNGGPVVDLTVDLTEPVATPTA